MATVLRIEPAGLIVEIADTTGEVTDYRLLPVRPGLDAWAVRLEHTDAPPGQGRGYRVALGIDGLWRCQCPAWRYRHLPAAEGGCKHIVAARDIREMVEQLR